MSDLVPTFSKLPAWVRAFYSEEGKSESYPQGNISEGMRKIAELHASKEYGRGRPAKNVVNLAQEKCIYISSAEQRALPLVQMSSIEERIGKSRVSIGTDIFEEVKGEKSPVLAQAPKADGV